MVKHLPFDERLQIAAQLIIRARIFYDVWWLYEGADTRAKIIDTMNNYSEFFRFDSHAHFVAFIVHLAGLYEARSGTVNLPALVKEAKDSGEFPPESIAKSEAALAAMQGLPSKLAILRSNLFAHRSISISYEDVFSKAAITADQLRDLTVAGLQVVNLLLVASGLQEQIFSDLPRHDVETILNALGKIPAT